MALKAVRRSVCAVAVCMAGLAHAQEGDTSSPVSVALEYSVAPTCPEAASFKAMVTAQLERDPFSPNAIDRALVAIAPSGHGLDRRIELRNAQEKLLGDRLFRSRSADCDDLARAMAFALALEIQFLAIAKKQAALTTPPSTEPPASATSQPQVAADLAPRRRYSVGAGGFAGFAMASSPAGFGRLTGGVSWPHWSLELAAEVGWPVTTRRDDGAGFTQQLLLAAWAGCGRLGRWSACLVAKGGEVRIEGKIDAPARPTGLVLQTGVRLAVRQDLGRHVYLSVHADGLFNLRPWKVSLDQDLVWTAPYFGETVGLDVGIEFR